MSLLKEFLTSTARKTVAGLAVAAVVVGGAHVAGAIDALPDVASPNAKDATEDVSDPEAPENENENENENDGEGQGAEAAEGAGEGEGLNSEDLPAFAQAMQDWASDWAECIAANTADRSEDNPSNDGDADFDPTDGCDDRPVNPNAEDGQATAEENRANAADGQGNAADGQAKAEQNRANAADGQANAADGQATAEENRADGQANAQDAPPVETGRP